MLRIFTGSIKDAEEKAAIVIEGRNTIRESAQYITILLDKIPHKDFVKILGAKRIRIHIEDAPIT